MDQQSSLATRNVRDERNKMMTYSVRDGFVLTSIAFERTDDMANSSPSIDLTELWIFATPGSGVGTCFRLAKTSPQRWALADIIGIKGGVESVDCVVKGKGGGDIGVFHLDYTLMVGTAQGRAMIEVYDGQGQLTMSWKKVTMSGSGPPTADIAGMHRKGVELTRSFERTGDLASLNEAIGILGRAVQLTPDSHPNMYLLLMSLGNSFLRRFEHTGYLSDITEAISAHHRAVQLTPDNHPNLYLLLGNLGTSLLRRFERTGNLSDVTEAISTYQRAVQLIPDGHADLPALLNNLGSSFVDRFEHTGDLSDIVKAISAHQRVVELTPDGHPGLPTMLSNLGTSLVRCFENTGDLSRITDAVSANQRAVQLTPEGDTDLPGWLNNLGNSLLCRFECTGNLPDIAEAISAQQRALQLTPHGHAALPGRLNNLGNSFQNRFVHTGDLSDIAEAISAHQRAVQIAPGDHADLPCWLNSLGNSFLYRFERTRDLADIMEAVSAQKRAVNLTPQDHAELPGRLSNLGTSFQIRFDHTGDLSDIAKAISEQEKALKLTPDGHVDQARRLNNLGASLLSRFKSTGDLSNIAAAISAHQRAVQLTPDGHPDLPGWLNNLGLSFQYRSEHTGELSDIAEAVAAHRKAVQLTPDGHADQPDWLHNLADALYALSRTNGSADDLDASIATFRLAATCISGSPQSKFKAARAWARLLNQYRTQSADTTLAFDTALQLVTLIAGLEQTVQSRHTNLHDVSDIALEAASSACSIGGANKALEWLEQGRCLVWNQLNQLRTPLDNLRRHNQQLASRVRDLSMQLENAGSSRIHSNPTFTLTEKISLEAEASTHLRLAREWEKLLGEVRAIPGFESFLQAPSCSSLLQHLPESGAIVVINVYKKRCDALALIAGLDEPLHIPLPQFSREKAQGYHRDMFKQLRRGALRTPEEDEMPGRSLRPTRRSHREEDPVRNILRGLWVDLVKPILDMLALSKTEHGSGKAMPRIWWCPTGPLSFLPIHAAGIYGDSQPESIMDYVVSSYTPNVGALTRHLEDLNRVDDSVSGLFLTSQPDAIAASPIPGTTREVQQIYQMAVEHGTRVAKLEGSEVTPQECLDHLERFSCVHLACHGSQRPGNPLLSKFSFHDGTLDLSAIIKKDLKHADLAFLSACQTSTGDEKLSEEAVHLAAGMLAAGYRRVVGTMWSIGDSTAQRIAVDFYDYLFKHQEESSGSRFDGSQSAYALHHAVQELRNAMGDSQESLLAWVPFVHFGN